MSDTLLKYVNIFYIYILCIFLYSVYALVKLQIENKPYEVQPPTSSCQAYNISGVERFNMLGWDVLTDTVLTCRIARSVQPVELYTNVIVKNIEGVCVCVSEN